MWPNPLDKLKIRDAVAKRETSVVLSGNEFTLKYRGKNKVLIQPTNTDLYVPRGIFPINTLSDTIGHGVLDPVWISDE